jgi:phosphomannomutase
MAHNPDIFRGYDIRGVYGKDFDDHFAFHLGQAMAQYFGGETIIVSRDLRASSEQLKYKLIEGIKSMGVDVIDIGETSTPLFYWAAFAFQAGGGVMVTASHLPEEYNGFKMIDSVGANIGLDSGLREIVKIMEGDLHPAEKPGEVWKEEVVKKHADFLIKLAKIKPGEIKLKVGVEGNALVERELGEIFKKLGIATVSTGHDILFGFDADADRLLVHNRQKEKIRGDLIFGLLAKERIGFWRKPTAVYDFRSSRGVVEDLSRSGLKLFPAPVGHTFIKAIMRTHHADVAGELSGHIFFKETNYSESTYLAALKILKLLQKFNTTIDELVKPLQTWAHSGEINFHLDQIGKIKMENDSVKLKIFQSLKERFKDGKIKEADGLTIDYPGWWFNVRMSMNEPTLRLVVEAKTKEAMEQRVEEISHIIKAAH